MNTLKKDKATACVLFNKKAGDAHSAEDARALEVIIRDKLVFIDVTRISDYRVFLNGLGEDDYIILCGGDGTLNRFVNNIDGITFDNDVLYFPNGTGNDFAYDLGYSKECNPFSIKEYLRDLPYVRVKGNNELVYSDIDKISKLVRRYKKILESGITFEQLIDMYMLDKEIFQRKQIELEGIMLKAESDPFRINEIESIRTDITSVKDSKEKSLSLRLANDLLYDEK